MAYFGTNIFNSAKQFANIVGNKLFGGGGGSITPQAAQTTYQPPYSPVQTSSAPSSINPIPGFNPVSSTTTNLTTTSGGGGGGGGEQQQPTQEQEPSEPSINMEALNQAFKDIDTLEAETKKLINPEGVGSEYQTSAFGRIDTAEQEAESKIAQQKETEGRKGEFAIGEQKRGISEIIKNLQARFGSANSTGLGAASAIGAEGLRQVGQLRAGLQETMTKIADAARQINTEFEQQKREVEANVAQMKQDAKYRLQSALSDITAQRNVLQSQKATMVNSALENYRAMLQDVRARNTAAIQRFEEMKYQADQQIRVAQSRVTSALNELPTLNFSEGETKAIPLNEMGLTDQAGLNNFLSGLEGTTLTGKVAGNYGILTNPTNLQSLLAKEKK